MPFAVGDPVRITVDRTFGEVRVPAGTSGRITQTVPIGGSCWVRFEGMDWDVLVPEEILEASP